MESKPPLGARGKVAGAAVLLGWFVFFNRGAPAVHFAPDDMMNMAYYFRAGTGHLLAALVTPWSGFYRPMGGLFYMLLFHWAGLNPAPYHAAILLILLGSVGLVYRFARLLGGGELQSGLAALVFCYHPGLSNLYYNSGFVYDALCLFFYLAAWVYYARIRAAGRRLGRGETAVFLALFLGALNSKEMAVTLPLALAAWEWLYHRAKPGWPLVAAAALDLIYVAALLFGREALAAQPGYGPVFSWRRLVDFQSLMLRDVFTDWHYAVWPVWVALGLLALVGGRTVRYCWLLAMAIAPLPIEFLQGRGAACLAIPAVGLALLAAVVFVEMANLFRRAGGRMMAAAVILAGVCLWAQRVQYLQSWLVKPAMAGLGKSGWEVIGQFRALHPQVRPGSQVVFLHDPSTDLETASIAQLWFRDRSVAIHLQRQNPLPPEELARMDYWFDFQDGKLVRLK